MLRETHLEFVKNRVTSNNTSFFETIKKRRITLREKKKKIPTVIPVLKEDRQALGLFVSKYTDKKSVFHYPLATYHLTIADPSGTYQSR